jgi:hypothetical protein
MNFLLRGRHELLFFLLLRTKVVLCERLLGDTEGEAVVVAVGEETST